MMADWISRALTLSDRILAGIRVLCISFVSGVVVMNALQYTVNSTRSTDHWVEYYDVRPTQDYVAIGSPPKFISQSIWHFAVRAAWPDVLRCLMQDGPEEGKVVGFRLRVGKDKVSPRELMYEPARKKVTGFYDPDGNLAEDSTDGVWTWGGQLPAYEAECWLEPNPVLNPSPFVYRHVELPRTEKFWFR